MSSHLLNALTPLDEALAQLLRAATNMPGIEEVGLLQAAGRVLAEDLRSALDVPGFDNSAMDGYAVRCADIVDTETVLPVAGRVVAGQGAAALPPMSAIRIFTGAPIPKGADAVVKQEDVQIVNTCEGGVRFLSLPCLGENIRLRGNDIGQGQIILSAGTRLLASHIGLAASVGLATVPVYKPLRVALLTTGNELYEPGSILPQDLPPGAIFNSNRYFLYTLLQQLGAKVSDVGIVPDSLDQTQSVLADLAREHDVIVSSGGVSVGEADYVKSALASLGSIKLWKLAIKPGKPFLYGAIENQHAQIADMRAAPVCHFLGLPGNPVASYVTFLLLARPFLEALQGRRASACPLLWKVRADFHLAADSRRQFVRVRLEPSASLSLHPEQNSGALSSVAWATGLADIPIGQAVQPGDEVSYLPFSAMFA